MKKLFKKILGKTKNSKSLDELFATSHTIGTLPVEANDIKDFTLYVKEFLKNNGYTYTGVRENNVEIYDSYSGNGLVFENKWFAFKFDQGAIAVQIQGSVVHAFSAEDFECFRKSGTFRIYTEETSLYSKFFLCQLRRGSVVVVAQYVERTDADGDFYTRRIEDTRCPFYFS